MVGTDHERCGGRKLIVGDIDGAQLGILRQVEALELVVGEVEYVEIDAVAQVEAGDVSALGVKHIDFRGVAVDVDIACRGYVAGDDCAGEGAARADVGDFNIVFLTAVATVDLDGGRFGGSYQECEGVELALQIIQICMK